MRNIFSCLLITNCSFGMLSAAVVPKTDCSSAHVLCLCGVLGSTFCLVCCRALASLSNLLRGLPQLRLLSLQSSWLLQRPGTVELFAAPQTITSTVYTLSFISAAFCSCVVFLAIFCVDVTSHLCDLLDSVSALTWFSHSSHPSPSTPRP